MDKKVISPNPFDDFTNSTIELVKWSLNRSPNFDENVIAIQTTRLPPGENFKLAYNQTLTSNSTFGAFNLGQHVGDNIQAVDENREALKRILTLALPSKPGSPAKLDPCSIGLQWLDQVHGNDVVTLKACSEKPITADASITREKHLALVIMTADCLPILIADKYGKEIAAIHGGWRPLSANIIARTIDKMHSKPEDLVVWLGPCIGPRAFEVGSDVKTTFCQSNDAFEEAFSEHGDGKFLANLQSIARLQLLSLGVCNITYLAECTYQKNDKYYSYRKDKITGRMASVICLR